MLATSYASGGKYDIVGEEKGDMLCATIPAQNFTMSKHRVIEHAAMKYLSPMDVEEFRMVVLDAGTRLASLLTVDYPSADLVSEALYVVTEVVDVYSLKGKWVTSWASSAKSEFLATSGIREESSIVTFFDMTCKSHVVHWNFLCRLPCKQ